MPCFILHCPLVFAARDPVSGVRRTKDRLRILDGDGQDGRRRRAAFGLSAEVRADGGQRERAAGPLPARVGGRQTAGRTGVYCWRSSVNVHWIDRSHRTGGEDRERVDLGGNVRLLI